MSKNIPKGMKQQLSLGNCCLPCSVCVCVCVWVGGWVMSSIISVNGFFTIKDMKEVRPKYLPHSSHLRRLKT